ncbi:MAG: PD40 domain-containing protein [Sedimentisphaerales bacterium]|nr:PD40 domain-containing protein [Sedimentisphaerales bacterium]
MKRLNAFKISIVLIVFAATIVLGSISNAQLNFGDPVNLGPNINSTASDGFPVISPDGCTMYFTSNRPGGYGKDDIYVATRESKDDEWGPAVNLGPSVNDADYDDVYSISSDGLSLYLYSDRSGGYGGSDLYVTTRATTSSPWGTPVNLGATVNSASNDYQPNISHDGLSMYFSSNRSGGYGGLDLWVTTRATTSSPWSTPVNLGAIINSSSGEYAPSISSHGLSLFFASTRPGGFGVDDDIWMTTRNSESNPWSPPVNLGPKINTPGRDGSPNISADGHTLYFISAGHGGYGYNDIFKAPIYDVPTCGDLDHPYTVGDFNKDCRVDVYDFLVFIEHWLECTAPECDETL